MLASAPSEPMNGLDENYRYQECVSTYADIQQRWLLIESAPARRRALKSVNRQVLKGSRQEARAFQCLCGQRFACQADAWQALEPFQTTLKFTTVKEGATQASPV